jgi:hypothetical protein
VWRAVRVRARQQHAPPSVLVVLDFIVEFFALNRAISKPHLRQGYGRHSEKERAWDRRRRSEVEEEGRRLVPLPQPQRDGFAEKTGLARRTIMRDKAWLVAAGLVHVHHEGGMHSVRDRHGNEHWIGRGGCSAGGVGVAAEWRPGVQPPPPSDPPPDPPSPAPAAPRPPLAQLIGPRPQRGP